MNLRFKIFSGFLILAVMLFTAGLVSIAEFKRIGYSVKGLMEKNYKSITAARDMLEALEKEHGGVLMLMSGDRETGRSTLEDAHGDFQRAFVVARNNITLTGEKDHIAVIEAAYLRFREVWTRPVAGIRDPDSMAWYLGEVHPSLLNVTTAVNRLMTLNGNALHETAVALQNQTARAIMPGIVAIVAALVFTLIFNFFINLYVITPIRQLTGAVTGYARQGEPITFRSGAGSRDELTRLAEAIQELAARGNNKNSRTSS